MWAIEFYVAPDGSCPTRDFLNRLTKEERARVIRLIKLLSEEGYNLKRPYADTLESGIYELRTHQGHKQYRVLYFYFYQDKIILSHGIYKPDKKVKTSEIEKAIKHKNDYFSKNKRAK